MAPSAFVWQIAELNVEVPCPVPPGGDIHAARPSPRAAKLVVQSNLASPLGLGRDRRIPLGTSAPEDGVPQSKIGNQSVVLTLRNSILRVQAILNRLFSTATFPGWVIQV
jgi:hypothetical protein